MKALDVLKDVAISGMEKISDKKPEIFMIAGFALGAIGVVSACRATLHVEEKLDEHREEIAKVKEEHIHTHVDNENSTVTVIDDTKAYRRELTKVYIHTGAKIVRLYAPTTAYFALSAAFILSEYKIIRELKTENISAIAGWKASEEILMRYRQKMREEVGEEEEQRFYSNVQKQDIEITSTDDKGKEKKVKVKGAEVINDYLSGDAFIFDESCGAYVGHDINHNLTIASMIQNQCSDNLHGNGCVVLNEIRDAFGVDRVAEGFARGCIPKVIGGHADTVDLGVRTVYVWDDMARDYIQKILIDPHLDGYIADMI